MAVGVDEPKPGQVILEIKGHVVPASLVSVSPRVAGHVVQLQFEEGQRVKAGELLARLDSAKYEATLKRAQAELNLAEAELAKANDGASRPDIHIAQAKVEIARTQVSLTQLYLESTTVYAPISGTILTKRAAVGTLIDPQAARAPTSVCDMADLHKLDIEIWVPERDLARAAKGQACLIKVDALPNATYRGRVDRILPVADKARAAVGIRVRIEVPDNDDSLRPGLTAIVTILDK
jgi:RND family efflux transporter MFP subunit